MARRTSSTISTGSTKLSTASSPAPDPAHIHVDEIRGRIISHSASMQRQSRIAKGRGLGPRQPDIDGFGLHVKAVFSHAGGGAPQQLVGPVRAIPAEHVDFRV